jgi:hypothetical protein
MLDKVKRILLLIALIIVEFIKEETIRTEEFGDLAINIFKLVIS